MTAEVQISKGPIIPRILKNLNSPAERRRKSDVIPDAKTRLNFAIETYEKIYKHEPSDSNYWHLSLLRNIQEGTLISFLQKELRGSDGYWLPRPKAVVPGMEITGLRTENYPTDYQEDIELLKEYFFQEYSWAKKRLTVFGGVWTSFLLRDYNLILKDRINKNPVPPFIGATCTGAGEELIALWKSGFDILAVDIMNPETSSKLFEKTWKEAKLKKPNIVIGTTSDIINHRNISKAKKSALPTIYPYQIDLSKPEAIPPDLIGITSISCSLYALHEMTEEEKVNFTVNCYKLSLGEVIDVDGYPTFEALSTVISAGKDLSLTLAQAILTHLLCDRPEVNLNIVKSAVPELDWTVEPIRIPKLLELGLLYPLQQKIIGIPR